MSNIFKNAIRDTGGLARLSSDNAQGFAASIQPCGFDGDGHSAAGPGFLKTYKLFAEVNEVSEKLKQGDKIIFDNRVYAVKSLAASYFGDKIAYISGILLLCEEEVQ